MIKIQSVPVHDVDEVRMAIEKQEVSFVLLHLVVKHAWWNKVQLKTKIWKVFNEENRFLFCFNIMLDALHLLVWILLSIYSSMLDETVEQKFSIFFKKKLDFYLVSLFSRFKTLNWKSFIRLYYKFPCFNTILTKNLYRKFYVNWKWKNLNSMNWFTLRRY